MKQEKLLDCLVICELCQLSYAEPNISLVSNFESKALTYISNYDENGLQAYFLKATDYGVLVIRGTDEPIDLLRNANTQKEPFLNGYAHKGMYQGAEELRGWLHSCMSNNGLTNLLITGHSMGGGIGLILAMMTNYETLVYTYGMPKVVTKSVTKLTFGFTHHRVVNNCDIIPTISLLYKHQGNLLYFDYDGKIHTKLTFWQYLKDQFKSRLRAWKKGEKFIGIYDHDLARYRAKISQNIEN